MPNSTPLFMLDHRPSAAREVAAVMLAACCLFTQMHRAEAVDSVWTGVVGNAIRCSGSRVPIDGDLPSFAEDNPGFSNVVRPRFRCVENELLPGRPSVGELVEARKIDGKYQFTRIIRRAAFK